MEDEKMRNELTFINSIGLPEDLVPLLMDGVCEYASLKKTAHRSHCL
jgi:hypothetical protein